MYKKLLITFFLLWSAFLLFSRHCGGCTVTVQCPRGPEARNYCYDLIGNDYSKKISIDYRPDHPGSGRSVIPCVPAGNYQLLENGHPQSEIRITSKTREIYIKPSTTVIAMERTDKIYG